MNRHRLQSMFTSSVPIYWFSPLNSLEPREGLTGLRLAPSEGAEQATPVANMDMGSDMLERILPNILTILTTKILNPLVYMVLWVLHVNDPKGAH